MTGPIYRYRAQVVRRYPYYLAICARSRRVIAPLGHGVIAGRTTSANGSMGMSERRFRYGRGISRVEVVIRAKSVVVSDNAQHMAIARRTCSDGGNMGTPLLANLSSDRMETATSPEMVIAISGSMVSSALSTVSLWNALWVVACFARRSCTTAMVNVLTTVRRILSYGLGATHPASAWKRSLSGP